MYVVYKDDVKESLSVTVYIAEIKLPRLLYSHGARRFRDYLK
jgi:hypothetical protein